MTEEEKPILVVIGQKGVGKSHFLAQTFKRDVISNHHTIHVTKKQEKVWPAEKDAANIPFQYGIDTVGFDISSGSSNFFDSKDLSGKPVVLLFLNNDLRIKTSKEQITARLDIPEEKIAVVKAHYFSGPFEGWETNTPDLLDKLVANHVWMFPAPTPKPAAAAAPSNATAWPVSTPADGKAPSNNQLKKERKKELQEKFPTIQGTRFFSRLQMDLERLELPEAFEALTFDHVTKFHDEGDKLLGLLAERTLKAGAIQRNEHSSITTNDYLSKIYFGIMGEERGKSLARKIYPDCASTDALTSEKYGDLVEALLAKTFSAHLLEEIFKGH